MFCSNCGKELDKDCIVCPSCGRPVHRSNGIYDEKVPEPEKVSGTVEDLFRNASETTYSYESERTDEGNGYAIASLVMGILSMTSCCCCGGFLFGILGIIFGAIALSGNRPGRNMAIVGIVLSVIGFVMYIISFIVGFAQGLTGMFMF